MTNNYLAVTAEEFMQSKYGQTFEEWKNSQPTPTPTLAPTPTPTPHITTTTDIAIRGAAILLAICIFVAIIYLLFKFIIPKTARYLGYLIWEFKKGREGNHHGKR